MCEAMGYTDERKKPVLKGWSTTSLRKRVYYEMKNGGFGLGRVRRRYKKGMEIKIDPCDEEGTSISKVKEKKKETGVVEDGMAVAESSKRKEKKKKTCAVEDGVAAVESSKRKIALTCTTQNIFRLHLQWARLFCSALTMFMLDTHCTPIPKVYCSLHLQCIKPRVILKRKRRPVR